MLPLRWLNKESAMLHPVKELKQCAIRATDGDIGRVHDVFFDDDYWTIRYLVVDTGTWLSGRHVLISPFAVGRLVREDMVLTVHSTREQIENSPEVDAHQPISRQYETAYARYYGYPFYWGGAGVWGAESYPAHGHVPTPAPGRARVDQVVEYEEPNLAVIAAANPGDVHLRSCNDVTGYHIDATDGDIGHVADFLVDDESWTIKYLVVDTSNWWFGNKVLISPTWVEGVNWGDSKAVVSVSRDAIRNAPPYNPDAVPDDAFDIRLHEHYGR
jgi:sporulation protein YlmC with PRC-barrel domain